MNFFEHSCTLHYLCDRFLLLRISDYHWLLLWGLSLITLNIFNFDGWLNIAKIRLLLELLSNTILIIFVFVFVFVWHQSNSFRIIQSSSPRWTRYWVAPETPETSPRSAWSSSTTQTDPSSETSKAPSAKWVCLNKFVYAKKLTSQRVLFWWSDLRDHVIGFPHVYILECMFIWDSFFVRHQLVCIDELMWSLCLGWYSLFDGVGARGSSSQINLRPLIVVLVLNPHLLFVVFAFVLGTGVFWVVEAIVVCLG